MDFKDQIRALGERVAKMKDHISTEEATKNAFIMPFIQVLGYDVFNPLELVPEFVADIGIKKGEKVDYAIIKDSAPIILIECKHWSSDLNPHNSQLFRYFHTTKARFGILTNGIVYRFYTDLVETNKMDEKPFFEFRIDDMKDVQIEKLKEFHKSYFNLGSIINTASELKYMSELRNLIVKEVSEPSDEFVRFFAKPVYQSIVTGKVLDQFRGLVKRTFQQHLNDAISERLKSALATEQQIVDDIQREEVAGTDPEPASRVQTTAEEMEAFYIVRAILCAKIKIGRIVHRDQQTYFGVLLDDNNRKPICRLHFNGRKKYVSFFDTGKEERVEISGSSDLYDYAARLISVVDTYDKSTAVTTGEAG
ncbi:restriction endonuclease [Flaviaesturariibacter flavus]|uniref:Restriction endonuclease n=1 Tax=Flaviaesturariibacter flavus TaxID=2502780 RepID=A0A4R1BMF7_9BACT|nr:type I restriction endonuclease [Flaviaesturariibacter flavus]TCJ18633.1 restriction endonuclease [Flaviaesturariibacter flavus]